MREENFAWDNEQTALLNLADIEKERDSLRKLLDVSLQINRELDLHKLLEVIIDGAIEVTGAERGWSYSTKTAAWTSPWRGISRRSNSTRLRAR